MIKSPENDRKGGQPEMKTPPIVSPEEWRTAREKLLVREKELTRARDAMAAERRRMPWTAVEKEYWFEGTAGRASLADVFSSWLDNSGVWCRSR